MPDMTSPSSCKPPTPKSHLLWGHALEMRRDLLGFLSRAVRDHGDIVRLRMGAEQVWLIARAEDIEHVLVTQREKFHKPKLVRVMGRTLFGDALTTRDGRAWRERRRVVAPAFHRERIDAHASCVVRWTQGEIASWQDGSVREIDRDLMRLTLCIAAESMFALELGGDAERFGISMRSALSGLGRRARFGFPTPDWLPVSHNRQMRRAVAPIHEIVGRALSRHPPDDDPQANLLSLLLHADARLDLRSVRDEVVAMLLGGSQPASLAVAWALFCLTQHPEHAVRLRNELDDVLGQRPITLEDLPKLVFTRAVIDETLRLYPPFFLLARNAVAECELGGYVVPRGTTLFMSPWVTQRRERYFENPQAFQPDRWLDGSSERLPSFAYFPFSDGPRACVAQRFALMQSTLVLATLLRTLNFALAPGQPVRASPSIALGFERGLHLIVRRRRQPTP